MKKLKALVFFIAIGSFSFEPLIAFGATDFAISISRKHASETCTSGYLSINGRTICHSLELAWNGNKPLISSIPAGKYDAHLRYDGSKGWRVELENVPGLTEDRSHVQIHTGNTPADSEGCILIGTGISQDLCSVSGSKDARKKLMKEFYGTESPTATPNKDITVTVED
jgi:hypothetical protein